MEQLKYVEECLRNVDYDDLQDFIGYHFGKRVEILWKGNDTIERYYVEPIDKVKDAYEWEYYLKAKAKPAKADFLRSDGSVMIPGAVDFSEYSVQSILDGLCTEGKLEPGDYLVEVSW